MSMAKKNDFSVILYKGAYHIEYHLMDKTFPEYGETKSSLFGPLKKEQLLQLLKQINSAIDDSRADNEH